MKSVLIAALSLMVLACSAAEADIIRVPMGSTNQSGEAVDVAADFRFTNNQLAITISNYVSNLHSVGQAVRSVSFALTTGQTAGSLQSSTATQRTIAKDGSFTDKFTQVTDWNLNLSGGLFNLTYSAPNQTIVGPAGNDGRYGNANSSLAGNNPHNPFLLSGATYYLSIPGVTENTHLSNVVFGLGTGSDAINGMTELQPIPEPATFGTLGLLTLAGLGLRRRPRAA